MVTLKDVAQRAGVTAASVSLVLSGKSAGRVSPERAHAIRKAARELNYVPNHAARTLRTHTTRTIGLISDTIASTPRAVNIIAGASRRARELGYMLTIIDVGSTRERADEAARILREQLVDRLVFGCMWHRDLKIPPHVPQPICVINSVTSCPNSYSCVPDERRAGLEATRHLIALGHRRIAYIGDPTNTFAQPLRLAGYRDAHEEAGIPIDERLVVTSEETADSVFQALTPLLSTPERPSALFTFNDIRAALAYRVAARCGLAIPHDLSVVSIDNLEPLADLVTPGLTTFELPHEAMARWGIDAVVSPDPHPPGTTLFPCRFVPRHSTARYRKEHS